MLVARTWAGASGAPPLPPRPTPHGPTALPPSPSDFSATALYTLPSQTLSSKGSPHSPLSLCAVSLAQVDPEPSCSLQPKAGWLSRVMLKGGGTTAITLPVGRRTSKDPGEQCPAQGDGTFPAGLTSCRDGKSPPPDPGTSLDCKAFYPPWGLSKPPEPPQHLGSTFRTLRSQGPFYTFKTY